MESYKYLSSKCTANILVKQLNYLINKYEIIPIKMLFKMLESTGYLSGLRHDFSYQRGWSNFLKNELKSCILKLINNAIKVLSWLTKGFSWCLRYTEEELAKDLYLQSVTQRKNVWRCLKNSYKILKKEKVSLTRNIKIENWLCDTHISGFPPSNLFFTHY